MKHVYPPRHPAWLDDPGQAKDSNAPVSPPPPGRPPAAAPQQRGIGRKAVDDVDGSTVTARGPAVGRVSSDQAAPDRGPSGPRQ